MSPRTPPSSPPPAKRRRRPWASIVEELALSNGEEIDTRRLAQRQKQVDFGKNTLAYDRFIAVLPRDHRAKGDPMTPLVRQKCSKRSFGGQVTSWKKKVYQFVAAMEDAAEEEARGVKKSGETEKGSGAVEEKVEEGAVEEKGEEGKMSGDGDWNVEDDDGFGDLDDIVLDDMGNVVQAEVTPPPSQHESANNQGKAKSGASPPSIFDIY